MPVESFPSGVDYATFAKYCSYCVGVGVVDEMIFDDAGNRCAAILLCDHHHCHSAKTALQSCSRSCSTFVAAVDCFVVVGWLVSDLNHYDREVDIC